MAETIAFDLHVTGSMAARLELNQQAAVALFMDRSRVESLHVERSTSIPLSVATEQSFSLEL